MRSPREGERPSAAPAPTGDETGPAAVRPCVDPQAPYASSCSCSSPSPPPGFTPFSPFVLKMNVLRTANTLEGTRAHTHKTTDKADDGRDVDVTHPDTRHTIASLAVQCPRGPSEPNASRDRRLC